MKMRTVLTAAATLAIAAAPAAAITIVAGVRVQTVATGVPRPTAIAVDARGGMWITSAGNYPLASDGVWYVPRAGAPARQVADGMSLALGLTWRRGVLYVAHVDPAGTSDADVARRRGRVVALGAWDGRAFGSRRVVLAGLPVGRHTIDNIVTGPDGLLYVGLGSVGDTRRGRSGLSATVLRFHPAARRTRST
jgi:glucose/arabinose dehydrogenase